MFSLDSNAEGHLHKHSFSRGSSNIFIDGEHIPSSVCFVLLNKYISLDLFSWWSLFPRLYFSRLEFLIIYVGVLILKEKVIFHVVHELVLYIRIYLYDTKPTLLHGETELSVLMSFCGKHTRRLMESVCLG